MRIPESQQPFAQAQVDSTAQTAKSVQLTPEQAAKMDAYDKHYAAYFKAMDAFFDAAGARAHIQRLVTGQEALPVREYPTKLEIELGIYEPKTPKA